MLIAGIDDEGGDGKGVSIAAMDGGEKWLDKSCEQALVGIRNHFALFKSPVNP